MRPAFIVTRLISHSKRPSLLADPRWRGKLTLQDSLEELGGKTFLLEILSRGVGLRQEQIDILKSTGSDKRSRARAAVTKKTCSLFRKSRSWKQQWDAHHKDQQWVTPNAVAPSRSGLPFTTKFGFCNPQIAHIHSLYHAIQIILISTTKALYTSMNEGLAGSLHVSTLDSSIRASALEICRSVDFYVSYAGEINDMFFAVFSIKFALQALKDAPSDDTNVVTQKWLRGRLQEL